MATTTTAPAKHAARVAPAKRRRTSPGKWIREHLVQFAAAAALIYLFLPILVVILFSFNSPTGRFNYTWNTFSLDAWRHPCDAGNLCQSLKLSLKIGVLATFGATVLGTLAAFAMARHRFRGRSATNLLIFVPMATPEVVMGSSLLVLFVDMGMPLGDWTILIAHILFCLSFVIVTVKARLAGLDPKLEEAARDLYANEVQTFTRVTLPLVLPGIVAAAMLSFSLSFDDFIITNFNSGGSVTFPMYVWGAAQRGTPVQINVIGTAMMLIALIIVLAGGLLRRRRAH
jgi:spermidine/putrescine transport system permease protein